MIASMLVAVMVSSFPVAVKPAPAHAAQAGPAMFAVMQNKLLTTGFPADNTHTS